MTAFLFKSALSMAALLLLYYALFQNQKMHRFNRVYLLTALIFSLALPLIAIPVYVEVAAETFLIKTLPAPATGTAVPIATPATDYTPYIIWGIYGIITAVLLFRFGNNLWRFKNIISQSETLKYKKATLVLADDIIGPHTFLHYIFINRQEYASGLIEPELFAHELAHVSQKHTLDILFIEVLKTVLWFNPLLYVYKHAMQLTHEFLADEAVLKQSNNVITYQQLLLQRATPVTTFALASSLNFSITKKRFTMMTKTTPKRALLLKLAALPVLAGLLYSLSTETVAQTKGASAAMPATVTDSLTLKQKRDKFFSGVRVVINDEANGVKIDTGYENLTDAQKDKYMPDAPQPILPKQPTREKLNAYKDAKTYAIWIDGKKVDNKVLNNYKPEDFAHVSGSFVHKNARSTDYPQPYQFHLHTPEYFKQYYTFEHFSGDTFTMNVTKEYKDGKVVAENGNRLSTNSSGAAIKYLKESNATAPEQAVYKPEQTTPQPEYPGGINAFRAMIGKNINMKGLPPGDMKLTVSFVVETDGSVTDIKVLKETNATITKELTRVIALSENWKPGMLNGKPVRTSYTVPVHLE